jgi:hypothetical protein
MMSRMTFLRARPSWTWQLWSIKVAPNGRPPVKSPMMDGATCWSGRTREGQKWSVRLSDARTVLQALPQEAFDCVITSPPYYSLRDYGIQNQIGLEETVPQYVSSVASTMDEVYRVL